MDDDTPPSKPSPQPCDFIDLNTQQEEPPHQAINLLSPTPTKPPRPRTIAEAMARRYEGRLKKNAMIKLHPPKSTREKSTSRAIDQPVQNQPTTSNPAAKQIAHRHVENKRPHPDVQRKGSHFQTPPEDAHGAEREDSMLRSSGKDIPPRSRAVTRKDNLRLPATRSYFLCGAIRPMLAQVALSPPSVDMSPVFPTG